MAGTSGRATTDKAGRAEPMNQEQSQVKSDAQAGSTSKAASVGPAVGGVHSKRAKSWKGESGNISPEHLSWLKARRRDSACSQASQRSEGQGDGSGRTEIRTPEKVRKLQRTLYRVSVLESLRRHHAARRFGACAPKSPRQRGRTAYTRTLETRMTECTR